MTRSVVFALALASLSLHAPARAQDCAIIDCVNLGGMGVQAGVDLGGIIFKANAFFGVDVSVYLTSAEDTGMKSPVYLPLQPGIGRAQVQVPDIYHAMTFASKDKAYVWQYVIGHEVAHAYQDRTGISSALKFPFSSDVAVELHADFLAGFFLARQYGLSGMALDGVLDEVQRLPTGKPGDADFHGSHAQRVVMVSRGALLGLTQPEYQVSDASACAVDLVFGILASSRGECG